MTAPPGGDVGVGVLEGRGDQRSELPLMKRSPSAARSLATDAPKRSAGSQRALDVGGQPGRRTPSAEGQRRRKEGGGTGPDGPQAASTGTRKEAISSSSTWLRHVASDGNISHVVQLEREMATELAQNAAEVAEVPGPRHVKYATVMAKNLRRDSQRASTPELGQGAANTRMTQEERRELARAQREVMWNLQKDEVVTIVRPGDDPVPYKRQGNPAVNTPNSVRKRLALRKKPLIQEIINEYWCFPGLNPEGSDEMTKQSYVKLNRKLHLALIPDITDEDAEASAEVDWVRDTARWHNKMTKEAFASSMFELADIWTENINEEEYTAFLWLLLETITNTNVVPPSFKPDRDIECIVDEDLSEATNRMRDALADELGRERDSLPLDVDGITALLADKTGRRDTLSPQLKDKYIQRLRTLRRRLQALKELRTWPVLGATLAETNGSGREMDNDPSAMEGGRPNGPQDDVRTISSDSGTIRESSEEALGGMAASSEGMHAEALGADSSLGSAVPPVENTLGVGRRIPEGGGVDRGGGAEGHGLESSVGRRDTEELDVQRIGQGDEGVRGSANNQDGEGRQQNDVVLPHPSRGGALIPGSDGSGNKEAAAKLGGTEEPDESAGVSRRGDSEGVLDSRGDSSATGATLSNGPGDNTHVVREDGGMPADMPFSRGGGAGNGAGPTDARASDRTDIEHPQDKTQQQRSDSAADDRGSQAAASASPVSGTAAASAIERHQEDDQNHPDGTRDVEMGDKFSSKRGEVDGDDESRRGGRRASDNRYSAGIARVENEDSNSNRIVQFENGSGGTRGSTTEDIQDKNGSDVGGSAGYAGSAGLGTKREVNGNINPGDVNLTHGETQNTDRAGSRNDSDDRPAGGDHEHSPSSALDTAYGTATSMQSTAAAGPSEGGVVAGYGGDTGGVTRGDVDGVPASSGHFANGDLTDNARHIGAGETPDGGEPGNEGEVLRERDGTDNGRAPTDHGSRQSTGRYGAVGEGGHQGDMISSEQRTAGLISPERMGAVDHQRDGDGGRGHGDRNGSERAPAAPAGVEQGSTINHAIEDVNGILGTDVGAGGPSQIRRPTSDSGKTSDTFLVEPGDKEYGGSSAIVSVGDGKSRPMQSENKTQRHRGAHEEAGGTEVEHGDSGGHRRVSFDVGGPDASSTPTRPSASHPQGDRGPITSAVGAGNEDQTIAASVTARDGAFHSHPGGGPGGWDGISGTSDEQWESMIGRAESEKQQRASRSVAGRAAAVNKDSPIRPAGQNPPTGYSPPSTTATDPPGSVTTEEANEAVAVSPEHATGTQEGLPSVDDLFKGDLSDRQGSDASGHPNLKRKTRSDSIEAFDRQGSEAQGGHGGNPDDPGDDYGRAVREDSPTLEDRTPGGLLPAVRDPSMKLETTVVNGAAETRQPQSTQGFGREQVETCSSDHGVTQNGTEYGDSEGLALRPSEHGEDMSNMAIRSHVGDDIAEAHANARKVSASFAVREGAARTEGEGLVESSTPPEARLEPVSDKHNTSLKDVLDEDSMSLKPQGISSVASPGCPTDEIASDRQTLPHSSKAAGGSALGDDLLRTSASASPSHVSINNQDAFGAGDSPNMEGGETRPFAHPGAYDTTIARPESRKGLGPWSTRDHENGEVSPDVENREVPFGGHSALGGLATHKNAADGQLSPDSRAVVDGGHNPSQSGAARPDFTGDAAPKGVGSVSVPELAFGSSFGGGGSESERAVVESGGVTAADRSTAQMQGSTGRQHSHRDTHAAEHGVEDASINLSGFARPSAEAESPRSGRQYATPHTARRSGGSFGAEHQFEFEAVGVGVKSRMVQRSSDGVSSHLDDNRRQRPRPSETLGGRAQVLQRQSIGTEKNNLGPEKGEGRRDQGFHPRGSSGGIRRYDDLDQQHRGIAPGTGMPVHPSNRGVYREAFKTGQTQGNYDRSGAIAGSRVGETRASRRPRKTSAAAGGAVGEGHRKPVRPIVEVPHAAHPRVANNVIAGAAPDDDSKVHVYNIDPAEGQGEAKARGTRTSVPAAREVDEEDVRRSITGRKVAATLPTGGSVPHTKMVSTATAEPATGATGRTPKGGGGAAADDERGQNIATSLPTGAKDGTPRIPSKLKTSPTAARPTRHGRISREPDTRAGDEPIEMRRPQHEQREPELRMGSLSSSNSVETSAASAALLDDCITKGKGAPLRVDLGRQDYANSKGHPRGSSIHDDNATNRGKLSAREGPYHETVSDRLRPPVSARGEQSLPRGMGGEWHAAYHDDSSRPEHYEHDRRRLSTAGNNSGVNGRLLGTKKRISPWGNDSARDYRETAVSRNENPKIRRAPAPPDSSGRGDDPADRTVKNEAMAARGRGEKGLGAVEEDVDMTARPTDAHHTFRNDRQRGRASHDDPHWITSTTQPPGNGIGSHWSYAQRNGGYPPDAERLGNRFNRPPQKHPVRPRTTPVSVNPQQHGDQQNVRRLRDPRGSDDERGRSVSLRDREEAGGPHAQQSDRGDRKMTFPSGRMEFKRPEDWRPMLGPLDAPQWGRPWQPAGASEVSVYEETLPYYVDRKQVWQFFPDLGLPPWRTPAPGEPGWDPIMNYCEVKQDEDKMTEDRKRREYLCRRRTQSRGGDWSSTTGGSSSLEGHDNDSSEGQGFDIPSVSARKRVDESSAVPENDGAREDEEDDEEGEGYDEGVGDAGSSRTALARKVNARRPPATAREAKHEKRVYFHDPAGLVGSPTPVRNPVPTPYLRKFKPLVHGGNGYNNATALIGEEVTADSYRRPEQSASWAMAAGRPRAGSTAVAPSHFLRPLGDAGEGALPNAEAAVAADFFPSSQTQFRAAVAPPRMVEGRAAAPVGKRYRHRRHKSLSVADNPPFTNAAGCSIVSRYRERGGTYYLPWQARVAQQAALGDGYKYRRRSDNNSLTRVLPATGATSAAGGASAAAASATAAPAFASLSRPYTNVGGSRWSQDVRLQQHARGRSRLAPSTRTAGGRWGASHGRLEALFPGEESQPPHPPDYWERWESGPWVLDVSPNL